MFVAPFLGAVVITYILENYTQKKDDAIKSISNFIKWILPVLIACFIGLLIFKTIISNGNYISGASKPTLISYLNLDMIESLIKFFIQGFMINFGYEGGVGLLSVAGILNVFKLLCIIPIIIIIPSIVMKSFKKNTTNINRMIVFYWILFLINFIICVISGIGSDVYAMSRYFQIVTIIAIIISSNYAYEKIFKGEFWISGIHLISVLIFIVCGIYSTTYILKNYDIKMQPTNHLIQTLKERNLKFGYATYWNAYKNSVIANYNPEIVAIMGEPGKSIEAMYHLNSKRFYKSEYYQGETFLLLTNEEFEGYSKNNNLNIQLGEPKEVIKEQGYVILIYNYNISKQFPNVSMNIGEKRDIKAFMKINENATLDNDKNVNVSKNGILYGPYTNLEKGNYELSMDCSYDDSQEEQLLRITSDNGAKQMGEYKIRNGENKVDFQVSDNAKNVEFVISNERFDSIKIKKIEIEIN